VSARADFTRLRFIWLDMVATDPRARGLATSIAVVLVNRYLNWESRMAWPSTERLAVDLGDVDRTSVQRGLRRLQRLGYLWIRTGGGRRNTNSYELTKPKDVEIPDDGTPCVRRNSGVGAAVSEGNSGVRAPKGRRGRTRKGGVGAHKTAAPAPPEPYEDNPLKEPVHEPPARDARAPPSQESTNQDLQEREESRASHGSKRAPERIRIFAWWIPEGRDRASGRFSSDDLNVLFGEFAQRERTGLQSKSDWERCWDDFVAEARPPGFHG
jgi:hypothetical protein